MLHPRQLQGMLGQCPWGANYDQWNAQQLAVGIELADEPPLRRALYDELIKRGNIRPRGTRRAHK
jgi:hypothetical protein